MKKFKYSMMIFVMLQSLAMYFAWDYRVGLLGYSKNALQASQMFLIVTIYVKILFNTSDALSYRVSVFMAFIVACCFEYAQKFGAFKVKDPLSGKLSATFDYCDLVAYAVGIFLTYCIVVFLRERYIPDE